MSLFSRASNRTNEVLDHSENGIQFGEFFDNNPLPMWCYDLNSWKFLFVNNAALNLFGFSKTEFLSKTIKDIKPDEEKTRLVENITNGGNAELSGVVYNYKKIDGNTFKVKIFATDTRFENQFVRVITAVDVKNSESSWFSDISTHVKFKNGLHFGRFAYWEVNIVNGKILYDERPFGLFVNTMPLYNSYDEFLEYLHPDDKLKAKQLLAKLLLENTIIYEFEYRLKLQNSYLWFRDIGGLIKKKGDDANIRLIGVTENITDTKLNNELNYLKELNKFKVIFQNSPDLIMLTNLEGKILEINRVHEDYTREEIIGANFFDLIPPRQQVMVKPIIISAIKTREQKSFELTVVTPKGNAIDWSIRISVFTFNNKPSGFVINFNDITEKVKSLKKIKSNEDSLRKFFEYSLSGNFISSVDGKILLANPLFLKIFGFNSIEAATQIQTHTLYKNPADRITLLKKIKADKKVENYELELIRCDGKTIHVIENVLGQFDKNGKLERLFGYIIDITESKAAMDRIRQLSTAVEQSPASVVITDIKGNIVYANPKCSQVTGYSFDELLGKNPRVLKSGELPKEAYEQLWKTIKSGGTWHGEFHNRKKNGELYWEKAIISPILNNEGDIINFLAVKEDITERKRMQEELISAKIKAEEMNSIKSNFLYNMSHELRTPLVGIHGFAEILFEEITNTEHRQLISSVLINSKRLTNTLNDILEFTKLESENVTPNFEDVSLSKFIKSVVQNFESVVESKSLYINFVDRNGDESVKIDKNILSVILNNIISNALKVTKSGGITITSNTYVEDETNMLLVEIADTGIGIPEDQQKIIFDEFRQGSEGLNRQFEGSGLGLTQAKKYTGVLGGNISLQSKIGEGTTVSVKIPIR